MTNEIDFHSHPTFDTRCMVHSGSYFYPSQASEKCQGRMFVMRGFWLHSHTGDLDGYICDKHADDFTSRNPRSSYLTNKITEAKL